MNRITPIAFGLVLTAVAPHALADTDVTFSGKLEAMVNTFSKDYNSCWNDGNARKCGHRPTYVTSESYARADGMADLTDSLTLIGRAHGAAYVNNAFYTVSKGAAEDNSTTNRYDLSFNPHDLYGEIEDTWLGLRHEDYGTVRIGRGLNPRHQALEGDYTTDLGGREMLEKMVAYDSPILIGEKGNGMSLQYAHYWGAHMRKEIRVYDDNDRSMLDDVRPQGDAILFDATLNGKLNVKFAYYEERYAAREFYPDGNLDFMGSASTPNTFTPNTGAKTRSHGPAVRATYEFGNYRIGLSVSDNRREAAIPHKTSYPSVGVRSQGATAFFSAWQGPWSLWAKVTDSRFRPDGGSLTDGYDWVYANTTFNVFQYGGEISYEFMKGARAVGGFDYKKQTFFNSPTAGGMCDEKKSHPCYNPEGYKVFGGIRWML